LLFRAETTDHARPRGPVNRRRPDRAMRWLYRRCAAMLYVGEHSRRHYLRLGCAEDRLVFSPYCVDTAPFAVDEQARQEYRTAVRAELELGEDQLAILFSGKLVPRKGPQLLLEAVRRLPASQRERACVLFLGDGELRESLRQSAGADPKVQTAFLGFQNQRQLSRYYHAADLLVLPSLESETWGLVVNEALHHGLPCVVSDQVGSAPDLVLSGKTGETFPAGSAPALAEALGRARQLTGRSDVRQACRAQVERYSVSRAAEGIAQAFRAVLDGRPLGCISS
jgi:glycosyltransferase involved in cell wall biosynthesis